MKSFDSNTIVNIVRAEIVTAGQNPSVLGFDTVTSAEPEPFISKGEESELRVRNTILAQDTLEDIIKGYDITLKDCVLNAGLLEIIDGGSSVASSGSTVGYHSPAAGAVSERTRFTLRLYTEEKDYGGQTVGVFRFSFPNCVGTPAKLHLENGAFVTPEYLVRSRPLSGDYAMTVDCMDKLPILCASAADLPGSPAAGDCIVAAAALTAGSISLQAGDTACYSGTAWKRID